MDPGGQLPGRTYMSVSMGPSSSMPPPLSTIPSPASAGTAGAVGVGGTIIVTSTQQQQQQQQPQQQAPQQSAFLRRKLSTNEQQVTVMAVRNTAPSMISISSTAPPLASFSSVRSPLPPASSLSSRLSIEQREGTVFVNRTSSKPQVSQATGSRGRNNSAAMHPILPKTGMAGGAAAVVAQPKVEIAKMDAAPPPQDIVIGRKDFMYSGALSFDECQHQQQHNVRHTLQSKVARGYTVQIGSTDIMSSHQPTKIGHTTIVKQNSTAVTNSHCIPLGQPGQLYPAQTTTAVLLPIQQSPVTHPQPIATGDYQRLASPTTGNTPLKVFRPIVPKPSPASVTATPALPSLALPCPHTITAVAAKASLGSAQSAAINVPAATGSSIQAINVGVPGPALLVQTVPASSSQAVTLQQQQQQQQLQPQSSFIPLQPAPVHQHVLPYGTTIKVTSASFEQQLSTLTTVNTIVPMVTTAGTSVIVSKAAQFNQAAATGAASTTVPVIQQQAVTTSAANKVLQTSKPTSLIRPPLVGGSTIVPPLYVQPSVVKSTAAVSANNASNFMTSKTPSLLNPVIDAANDKQLIAHHRVIATTSSTGGVGQPARIFVATTAATSSNQLSGNTNNITGVPQLKQQQRAVVKKLALPPVPKLAPFITTAHTQTPPPAVALAPPQQQASVVDAMRFAEKKLPDITITPESKEVASSSESSAVEAPRQTVTTAPAVACARDPEQQAVARMVHELYEEKRDVEGREQNDGAACIIEVKPNVSSNGEIEILEEEVEDEEEEHIKEGVTKRGGERIKDVVCGTGDDGEVEMLDFSFEANENEPQCGDDTVVRTVKDDVETTVFPLMEIVALEVTPRKDEEKSDTGATAINGSRISPRMQKRSLSEQLQHRPSGVVVPFAGVEANMEVLPKAGPVTKNLMRKRAESVHARFTIDRASTFQHSSSAVQKRGAITTGRVYETPDVVADVGSGAVAEDRKMKRPPLKDATNEPAEEGQVAQKEKTFNKQEKKDVVTTVGGGGGGGGGGAPQNNVLLLCDEKFDMVSNSSSAKDEADEAQPHSTRRTSRRLDTIRRGLEFMEESVTEEIKLDMDDLTAFGLRYDVAAAGREGEDFATAIDHAVPKSKKAKLDENSSVGFVATGGGHVRSSSTSSDSNITIKQYGGRRSLPELCANNAVVGPVKKGSSKKSTTAAAPAQIAGARVRQASIRTSLAGPPSESSFSVTEDKDSKEDGGGAGGQGNADITTVSDHLRWHDGIGYLDGSQLHFDFNEFGLVQPITAEQYERHCSTDVYAPLMMPVNQRPVQPKVKPEGTRKRGKSPDSRYYYRCTMCRARGNAAEFATPDFCSIECVELSGQPAVLKYIQHSTHALQHKDHKVFGSRTQSGTEGKAGASGAAEEVGGEKVRSKKKSKRAAKDGQQQRQPQQQQHLQQSTSSTTAVHTVITPSTTTTPSNNTSDDDSRSSLSLNSNSFVRRQHLQSLNITSPPDSLSVCAAPSPVPSIPPAGAGDGAAMNDKATVGSDNDDGEFNWAKYLRHVKAVAAPPELFGRQPYPAGPNKFKTGMKLEAIDPENCSLFCVCTVAEVRGYRIKLHFDGYPDDYDFWVNADTPDIFPPGWCRSTNRVLQPPKSYTTGDAGTTSKVFRWKDYLLQTGATVPDHRCFPHVKRASLMKNDFDIGMMLEADDLKKSGKVCVASVADKLGDRILVHFDGWDERYDYWVHIRSPYIHPVEWHVENNDKITPPPDWHKPFNWERYIRHKRHRCGNNQGVPVIPAPKELFQTRPPVAFKPGQRVEVVDRKQQIRIRPATVVAIDDYEVQVCFDGWPQSYSMWIEDDSPNIHPINWCSRTSHPLEPPPNYLNAAEVCDGTCEIRYCMGRGNAKYPSKKYHDRPAECPYKRSNWMCEFHKALRISHNQVQKQLTDVFSGGLYENGDRRTNNLSKVKSIASSANQTRTDSPRPGKHQQQSAVDEAAGAVMKRSSSSSVAADGVPLLKRLKQESGVQSTSPALSTDQASLDLPSGTMEAKSTKDRVSRTVSESRSAREAKRGKESANNTTSADGAPVTPQEASLRIALPVIDDYGPRLLHSYEVWRRNSRLLDECTERNADGEVRRMKNPLKWTTDETARYIEQLPGCDECAIKIRHEEITGKSFLSFTQDDLVKYMGIKVGPAIKVYNRIIHLRQLVTRKFIQLS